MKTPLHLAIVSVIFAAASCVQAQPLCPLPPIPDGFEVGCCAPPSPFLPSPGAQTLTAAWGVYNGCTLGYTANGVVQLGAPVWVLCDYAIIPITIQLPNLMPIGGTLFGKYARSWVETGTSAFPQQVWRILVNGDLPMFPSTICTPPTCIPPCTGAPYFSTVHMVGHIDYACDPSIPGSYDVSFSLTHLPGSLQHAAFSSNPIPALANSPYTYHLVGPGTFSFVPVAEPQGILPGESLRNSTLFFSPFFYQCHGEGDVLPGTTLTTATSNCLTSGSTGTRFKHQSLSGADCCIGWVSPFQTVPVPGTVLAPTGLMTMGVGKWTNAASFPGVRDLVVYVGVMTDFSSCSPVLQPLKIVTGVGTTTPVPVGQTFPGIAGTSCVPPQVILARSFIDLQNMIPLANFPTTNPGIGSLFVADWVLSLVAP